MTGVALFVGFFVLLFVAAAFLARLVSKGQKAKSMGELMQEDRDAYENLKTHNDVLKSTPVDGAARRVSDKWTRPE